MLPQAFDPSLSVHPHTLFISVNSRCLPIAMGEHCLVAMSEGK